MRQQKLQQQQQEGLASAGGHSVGPLSVRDGLACTNRDQLFSAGTFLHGFRSTTKQMAGQL